MKIQFFFLNDEASYASSNVVTADHIRALHKSSGGLTTYKVIAPNGLELGCFTATTTQADLESLIASLDL